MEAVSLKMTAQHTPAQLGDASLHESRAWVLRKSRQRPPGGIPSWYPAQPGGDPAGCVLTL